MFGALASVPGGRRRLRVAAWPAGTAADADPYHSAATRARSRGLALAAHGRDGAV